MIADELWEKIASAVADNPEYKVIVSTGDGSEFEAYEVEWDNAQQEMIIHAMPREVAERERPELRLV